MYCFKMFLNFTFTALSKRMMTLVIYTFNMVLVENVYIWSLRQTKEKNLKFHVALNRYVFSFRRTVERFNYINCLEKRHWNNMVNNLIILALFIVSLYIYISQRVVMSSLNPLWNSLWLSVD